MTFHPFLARQINNFIFHFVPLNSSQDSVRNKLTENTPKYSVSPVRDESGERGGRLLGLLGFPSPEYISSILNPPPWCDAVVAQLTILPNSVKGSRPQTQFPLMSYEIVQSGNILMEG